MKENKLQKIGKILNLPDFEEVIRKRVDFLESFNEIKIGWMDTIIILIVTGIFTTLLISTKEHPVLFFGCYIPLNFAILKLCKYAKKKFSKMHELMKIENYTEVVEIIKMYFVQKADDLDKLFFGGESFLIKEDDRLVKAKARLRADIEKIYSIIGQYKKNKEKVPIYLKNFKKQVSLALKNVNEREKEVEAAIKEISDQIQKVRNSGAEMNRIYESLTLISETNEFLKSADLADAKDLDSGYCGSLAEINCRLDLLKGNLEEKSRELSAHLASAATDGQDFNAGLEEMEKAIADAGK